ncbi:MAG TPA: Stp1/IreP family PP2C-type Ser/Thr phosphatase [Burkholderiaceae bacterium]|nr:Stp1/IreP family PP2C-type Ser/Thr phosphatase [Burkholderiaceae bacterium]
MIAQICSETDPGRERSQNEDSVAFDAPTGLCILADGMGGHNAGEVASGMAAAFIKSELRAVLTSAGTMSPVAMQEAIVHAVTQANGAIFNMSRANSQYYGMGTTLVVAVFNGDALTLAHIGDSRCYRLRGDQMQQLTSDHSVFQEQIDSGLIAADHSAPRTPGQNLVTRALGVDEIVQADINRFDLALDDIYLLCSDGLSDMVSDDAIAAILRGDVLLEQKAKQLVVAANEGGGRDNISVVLAQVCEEPKAGFLGSARRAIKGVWSGGKRD